MGQQQRKDTQCKVAQRAFLEYCWGVGSHCRLTDDLDAP
jgi:hypothetical protein